MNFPKFRVKDILGVVRYIPTTKQWRSANLHHIVGIKLKGKALHTLKNDEFMLTQNCVYFFNQKDVYHVQVLEPSEAFSIHFTTFEDIETDSFYLPLSAPDTFVSVLQKAETAQKNGEELLLVSLLYQFLAELESVHRKKYFPKDKRMTDAKSYIDTHFTDCDCLEKAIENSQITARRFGELFRVNFGTTPNRYITFKRIEYAKSLLLTKTVSVSDVATLCGYSDIYYFSKVFKKETGVSPIKWN